jgi:hypothetical protein
MPLVKSLAAAGDLKLWLDFRAGHCANQAGYAASTFDGVVAGSAGRFRTGFGFETSYLYDAGDARNESLGYINVGDNAAFYPPVGGMCLIASYIQSSAAEYAQIIGQSDATVAGTSWVLVRTSTHIRFLVSDGVAIASFSYAIAAVPGQVETVAVRYTGGTGVGNCTIAVIAPTPSSSTGQLTRVPQNSPLSVTIGCENTTLALPFFGTMRYVAYVRGAQTVALLTALIIELEGFNWPNALCLKDESGSVADRAVQYMSKFGVDCTKDYTLGLIGAEVSNSRWVTLDAAKNWLVAALHSANAGVGSPADIQKVLQCGGPGGARASLKLGLKEFSAATTETDAAYGTWDFWVRQTSIAIPGKNIDVFVVHQLVPDGGGGWIDDGYAVNFAYNGNLTFSRVDLAVATPLITVVNAMVGVFTPMHIRVTRDANNRWRLFYDVGAGWRSGGTAVDAAYTASTGMALRFEGGDVFLLGNHRSEKALYKWKGVVNPL